jgi:hypothetical protein
MAYSWFIAASEGKRKRKQVKHSAGIVNKRQQRNLLAQIIDDLFQHQHGPCAAQNVERLASKQGVYNTAHCSRKHALHHALHVYTRLHITFHSKKYM